MSSDTTSADDSFTLGRYRIVGQIAKGGMATVYLAKLEAAGGFNRDFALKVVHPHLTDSTEIRARMLEEARLASRVRHPNAVRTVDAGEDQGYAFLVLELIDGVNLRELMLHRSRPFSAIQAAGIIVQVARGLHALHTATSEDDTPLQMVHRDVSPHNVMLDRTGRAIVIDLGLAKAADRELTQVGVLCGKLPYMSPEQSQLGDLDARSDVFSLGTVLFELVSEDLPFGDTHSGPTLTRLQACDATSIDARLEARGVPGWYREIVLACLRPNPEDRFDSAHALAEALAQELGAAGQDEAVIRQGLRDLVDDAYETLGGLDKASLPPRLTASGPSHPVVAPPATEPAAGWKWAAAGGLAVALLSGAAYSISGARGSQSEATPSTPQTENSAASMTRTATEPTATRSEKPPRKVAPEPAAATLYPVIDTTPPPPAGVDPALADPAQKRRPTKARPTAAAPELKPNPYQPR